MAAMQRSIASKSIARTPARIVRPAAGSRERRLGLGSPVEGPAARPADPTSLGRCDLGPFKRLRARWRAFINAAPRRRIAGRLRPADRIAWAPPSRRGLVRRTGSRPAAWLD